MKCRNVIATIVLSACVFGLTACGGDSGPTPGALSITTTSLPDQTVNRPYSASVSGSGGALPYTWSVTPALPANLSFDTATGAITGTPTKAGTTTHTFTLRDSSAPSQTVEQTLNLTIDPPLAITTTSLPNASISSSYNQPVATVGGIGALTFTLVPGTGTLPQNLSLNPTTGLISGTPIAPPGSFPFTVRVADEGGQEDTQALSVQVTPTSPPQITSPSQLPSATAGQPYNQRVQATGGIGALTWTVSAGSLPAGLILEPSGPTGGTISGTPTSGGPSNFTVRITDSVGQFDTQAFSISVTPLSITTTSLPPGSIGQPYSQRLLATGAVGTLTWNLVAGSGNLPAGLNLSPTTGVISGTPVLPADTSSFTVRAADAAGQVDTQALSITINLFNVPNITTGSLPGGTVDQEYNQTLQATGGIGLRTWTLSGSLPAGLTLSQDGIISGTPTNAETTNFTVTVTDAFNQSDAQNLSIAVSPAPLVITTTTLPAGGILQPYNQQLQATGGTGARTWSIVAGAPPLGVDLNSAGVISGTPILPVTSTFTVRVADQGGQEVTQVLSITIN